MHTSTLNWAADDAHKSCVGTETGQCKLGMDARIDDPQCNATVPNCLNMKARQSPQRRWSIYAGVANEASS